jgi:hypothetical protein
MRGLSPSLSTFQLSGVDMAVSYEDGRKGLPWPEPLNVEAEVKKFEERVDKRLREGSLQAKVNRKHPHVDTVAVAVAELPFEDMDLKAAPDVQRALELRYRAAGWDYARVEFPEGHVAPFLILGRARQPVRVVIEGGDSIRVVPEETETPEQAAQRVAREGVWRATENGFAFVPPSRIQEVVVSPVPDVRRPIG